MAESPRRDLELDELIFSVIDGKPSAEQVARLNERVSQDPAAAERLVELSELHVMAQWLLGEDAGDVPEASSRLPGALGVTGEPGEAGIVHDDLLREIIEQAKENRRLSELAEQSQRALRAQQADEALAARRGRGDAKGVVRTLVIPRGVFWGGIAAALLLTAWAGITLLNQSGNAQSDGLAVDTPGSAESVETDEPRPIRVGQVVDALDALWDQPGPATPGAAIYDRPLTLLRGIAQIELTNGVRVTLEGPCTFKPDSPDRVHLTRGKLVGNVPPNAVGFTVHTPGMDVIDLSTEFAIRVDEVEDNDGGAASTEVSVLDGKVQVRPGGTSGDGGEGEIVLAGESRRAEQGVKLLLAGRAEPSAFYRRVPDAYEKSVRDLGPVAYWRFEDTRGLALTDNLARSGDRVMRVGRVDAEAQGAVGGAASFDGQSRLVLERPRGLDLMHSFTIAAWVYVEPGGEGLARVFSNALFVGNRATAGFGLGVKHLAAGQPQAFFTFYGIADYRGNTPLPTGRWVHLAVSIDRKGQPTFYIDGVADAHRLTTNPSGQTPPPPGRLSDADVWIGDAPVAGAAASEAFQGRIDELVVLPSVLSPEQIERLATRPTE